jgi:tetratricopeptide (TPR) repeat protein
MVFALRDVIEGLHERPRPLDELFSRYGTRALAPDNLAALKLRAGRIAGMGLDRFLKLAAMLHADIARVDPAAHVTTSEGVGHLVSDGRNLRDEGRPWHWMLGRSLLHLVRPRGDPHARLWYVAVAHHLQGTRNFTEANPHLERALELFPDDAEVQFLRGLLHEAQSGPDIQAAVAEKIAGLPARDQRAYRPSVRPAKDENTDARDAYERAVAADPSHLAARIRLGRTLLVEGKADAAAGHLRTALAGTLQRRQRYLALLLLGRAEELARNMDGARAAYTEAAALYPDAQSPRLALSQIALQAGDRAGAAAMFPFLSAEAPDDAREDPWWRYFADWVPNRAEWLARLETTFGREVK